MKFQFRRDIKTEKVFFHEPFLFIYQEETFKGLGKRDEHFLSKR